MSDTERIISSAVKALPLADRPEGLPSLVTIRAMDDREKLERPYLLARCENGSTPHPKILQTVLILRLATRADEQEGAVSAAWHKAAVDYFRENSGSLYATLLPHGLQLIKFNPGAFSDTEDDDRSRIYEQRWNVVIERVPT